MNEQEQFWENSFGDNYISRNNSSELISSNISFFLNALKRCDNINSIVEFGPNIGMNLRALNISLPKANLHGVEINAKAAKILEETKIATVTNCSIKEFEIEKSFDLSFTKGVLIHINPNDLILTYNKIFESSNKYILIAEYFNDVPSEINYRGFKEKLFKRDFAGEFLDLFPSTKLIDYGFVYKRDPMYPLDNISWFLIEKY